MPNCSRQVGAGQRRAVGLHHRGQAVEIGLGYRKAQGAVVGDIEGRGIERGGGIGDEKLAIGIDLHRHAACGGGDHRIDIAIAADMQQIAGAGAEADGRGLGERRQADRVGHDVLRDNRVDRGGVDHAGRGIGAGAAAGGVADIERVAIAGTAEQDVAQDTAAIVDGQATGGVGRQVDRRLDGTDHRAGVGRQGGVDGGDGAGIVDGLQAAALVR